MNNIKTLFVCPVCGKRYQKGDIKLVQDKREMLLLHTNCKFCKNSSLALYSKQVKKDGSMAMGVLTDLDYEEACQMILKKPITVNEVLDFYQKNR